MRDLFKLMAVSVLLGAPAVAETPIEVSAGCPVGTKSGQGFFFGEDESGPVYGHSWSQVCILAKRPPAIAADRKTAEIRPPAIFRLVETLAIAEDGIRIPAGKPLQLPIDLMEVYARDPG